MHSHERCFVVISAYIHNIAQLYKLWKGQVSICLKLIPAPISPNDTVDSLEQQPSEMCFNRCPQCGCNVKEAVSLNTSVVIIGLTSILSFFYLFQIPLPPFILSLLVRDRLNEVLCMLSHLLQHFCQVGDLQVVTDLQGPSLRLESLYAIPFPSTSTCLKSTRKALCSSNPSRL